jgi:hypothetical protein
MSQVLSKEEQVREAQILRSPIHSDLIIKCIYSELICSAFTVRIAKRGTSPRSKILRSPIYSDRCHQYTRALTFQNLPDTILKIYIVTPYAHMYPPPHMTCILLLI